MSEEPNASPNPKILHTSLVPCIDGKPIESAGSVNAARLKLADQLYGRDVQWCVRRDGKLVPVSLEDITPDDEALQHQNAGAFPESPRGLIAALASVRAGRAESARRAQHNADPAVRAQQERERQLAALAGEESCRHLRENTP